MIEIDLSDAHEFIEIIAGSEKVTFDVYRDRGKKKKHGGRFHGYLEDFEKELLSLNQEDYGIFMLINAGDLEGRSAVNVTHIRGVWVDLDGSPSEPVTNFKLRPTLVIESSPERYHGYWLLDKPYEVTSFKESKSWFSSIQKSIAYKFDGDSSISDLSRIMRVPGFYHNKKEPFLTKIIHKDAYLKYDLKEIKENFKVGEEDNYRGCHKRDSKFNRKTILSGKKISKGQRHTNLHQYASSARARGLEEREALTSTLDINKTQCDPPLEEEEVREIVRDTYNRYKDGKSPEDKEEKLKEYERLEGLINELTDDYEEDLQIILEGIVESMLDPFQIHMLLLKIKGKTGKEVGLGVLREQIAALKQSGIDERLQHLDIARSVISDYGQENLLAVKSGIYAWNGKGLWVQQDSRVIRKRIHEAAEGEVQISKHLVESVLHLIETEVFKEDHEFNTNPNIINCKNGELHFIDKEWKLKKHKKKNYCTSQLSINYDPNAVAVLFQKSIREWFQGDSDALEKEKLIYEMLGYTLLPDSFLEKFILLIGSGANGKSVLLSVVESLCGERNVCAVPPNKFVSTFQRAHLLGKLANIVTEISQGAQIPDAELKSIVSGELITVENKFKAPFDFRPYATLWFGTNHMPDTKDFSEALFRRTLIVKFNNCFKGKSCNVSLKKDLMQELPGILNLALSHFSRVLLDGQFTEPPSSKRATEEWKFNTDPVAEFVDEMCKKQPFSKVSSREIYDSFQGWAVDNESDDLLSHRKFTQRLGALGFQRCKGSGGKRMILGLQLKTSDGWR